MPRSIRLAAAFVAGLVAFLPLIAGAAAAPADAFPPAKPEEVGIDPKALAALDAAVRSYVEHDEAVGGELLVIARRRTVWHTAHGFADREEKRALEPGAVYCLRSMTKSIVGTVAQMLIDDGTIGLEDRVAKWLPEFGHDRHALITVRQLLEHTSGLPLSSLIPVEPRSLTSLRQVAALASKAELAFDPGQGFNYSDDGADTMAAIIEVAAKQPIATVVRERLLEPLDMRDTYPVAPTDAAARTRFASGYAGSPHAWLRFWNREEAPIFPCFLGSQGMFGTAEDYAKLLALWADHGMHGTKRLLSTAAIERGLAGANAMAYPSGFAATAVRYGQFWMVWESATPADGGGAAMSPASAPASTKRVAFGHGGSDGTIGWCWPERDLIVCYFTQSRGGFTVLSFEREIARHLLGQVVDAAVAADPAPLFGVYWDEEDSKVVAVALHDGKPEITAAGLFAANLVATPVADRWALEVDANTTITPERDAQGAVVAIVLAGGAGREKRFTRLVDDPALPSVDAVVERMMAAHALGALGDAKALRRTGTVEISAQRVTMAIKQTFRGTSMRVELARDGVVQNTTLSDGTHMWSQPAAGPLNSMEGALAEQGLLEHPARQFGDWRKHFAKVRVLKKATIDGTAVTVVRCEPALSDPIVYVVDDFSGRVVGVDRIATLPRLGRIGVSARLDDFREVGGVTMPFHATVIYATPLVGAVETRIEKAEIVDGVKDEEFKPTPKG